MKVVICGAGMAGLTLAKQLGDLGDEVVVLERSPAPRQQGYMIDFFGPGFDAAEAMGLLPAIDEIGYRVEEVSLVDERGRRRAALPYDQFAAAVGGRLRSVMRPDLEKVLRESLPRQVDLRFGAALSEVDDHGDGVTVGLEDGTRLRADLLVGADGIHSTVRRLVFGDEQRFLRFLGFHTAAYVFDDPAVAAATAGRFVLTDTVGKQMGFYRLRDGRVAVFAVHRTEDPKLPADVRGAVRDAYGGLGWLAPAAIDKCPPSHEVYYDQVSQIVLPRWSRGRVTLVGDACYAVSLLAGQGASLGIAGAYLLADRLHTAPSIADALADYERLWRPVAEEKQASGRSAARWFLPRSALGLWVRRAALRLAAHLPMANRYVGAALAGKSTGLIASLRRSEQSGREATR